MKRNFALSLLICLLCLFFVSNAFAQIDGDIFIDSQRPIDGVRCPAGTHSGECVISAKCHDGTITTFNYTGCILDSSEGCYPGHNPGLGGECSAACEVATGSPGSRTCSGYSLEILLNIILLSL